MIYKLVLQSNFQRSTTRSVRAHSDSDAGVLVFVKYFGGHEHKNIKWLLVAVSKIYYGLRVASLVYM